jgi:SAM-dependent methyltransferase
MFDKLLERIPTVKSLLAERDDLISERDRLLERLTNCRCLPVPPAKLRYRVGAEADLDNFLIVGRRLECTIRGLVAQTGRRFESFKMVLDFGCGCGRVTRHFRQENQTIVATDIDREAIEWCRDNLSEVATFAVNAPAPPLEYPDSTFDLIYGISVFTHLPEDMATVWLAELNRVLKPDGLLVTSLLEEKDLIETLPDDVEALAEFKRSGFYYTPRFGMEGLPGFYGVAFHRRDYVERAWSEYFKISMYEPRAINYHQCGVVFFPAP